MELITNTKTSHVDSLRREGRRELGKMAIRCPRTSISVTKCPLTLLHSCLGIQTIMVTKFSPNAVRQVRINSYSRRAFPVAAPLLWNTLPIQLNSVLSLDVFKSILKTFLFIMYVTLLIHSTRKHFNPQMTSSQHQWLYS